MIRRLARGSFLTILELVIVLAIILFLAQRVLTNYCTRPAANKEIEKIATDTGINTENPRSMIGSTKDKVDSIMQEREKQLEQFGQ